MEKGGTYCGQLIIHFQIVYLKIQEGTRMATFGRGDFSRRAKKPFFGAVPQPLCVHFAKTGKNRPKTGTGPCVFGVFIEIS